MGRTPNACAALKRPLFIAASLLVAGEAARAEPPRYLVTEIRDHYDRIAAVGGLNDRGEIAAHI